MSLKMKESTLEELRKKHSIHNTIELLVLDLYEIVFYNCVLILNTKFFGHIKIGKVYEMICLNCLVLLINCLLLLCNHLVCHN